MLSKSVEGAPGTGAQRLDAIKSDPLKIGGKPVTTASYGIGDVVRHKHFPFRGIVFDVDPEFANTDEWWEAIPEDIRPSKQQPFYHLFAENDDQAYVAYVSQQNLMHDDSEAPILHPAVPGMFERLKDGSYRLRPQHRH